MLRFFLVGVLAFFALATIVAGAVGGSAWWALVVVLGGLLVLGCHDVLQTPHQHLPIGRRHPGPRGQLRRPVRPARARELLNEPPAAWREDWEKATADRFTP